MAQPIIVTAGPAEPEGGASESLAFTAGVTATVAGAAAEVATEAAQAAQEAADDASAARETAWDAQAAVAALEGRFDGLEERVMETLGEIVTALNTGVPAGEDDGAPERIVTEEPKTPAEGEQKPAKRRHSGKFGSDWWFGGRS